MDVLRLYPQHGMFRQIDISLTFLLGLDLGTKQFVINELVAEISVLKQQDNRFVLRSQGDLVVPIHLTVEALFTKLRHVTIHMPST